MSYGNNVNAPFGLKPSQYLNGTTFNGQPNQYSILNGYATSIFTGDPVTWAAGNDGTIGIGVSGSPVLGVFAGVQYVDANGITQFFPNWTANTVVQGGVLATATAFVIDDPNVLWDIQVDNSVGPHTNPFVIQSDMGRNANFVIGAGNTSSGQSTTYLDKNTLANTATLNCKLIRFTPVPGNGPGTAVAPTIFYNNVLVLLNNHIYGRGTGTLGTH